MSLKICEEVEILKANYDDPIEILDGLTHKQSDVIKMVEFYSNSRYLKGNKDERGKRKAFYQILNGMCDVENAAVDLDTKDVEATSDDEKAFTLSMLISKDIYQWMKEADFGLTLNNMKKTRTKYGSLLVKKCMEKDEDGEEVLKIETPEWKNVITDQVDIMGNPIIETHFMTVMELMKKRKVWNKTEIDKIIADARKNGKGKRIVVHELRGEFPRSYYKQAMGEESNETDEDDFSYQLYHLCGGVETKKQQKMSDMKVLWAEDDTERVYKYLDRKPRSGRAFGVGVFEEGEEAQVMVNDTILKQNRAMAYTSKVIGQTATKKLKGRNMLDEVDDGAILEHDLNSPISTLQLLPAGGLGQYGLLLEQWFTQFERTTSSYAAQRGETPPSGTPFRLQASILQQSSSVFIDLKEEFGLFVNEIIEDWVMPHLADKLNAEHVLAFDFTPEELMWMDKNYATREANRRKIEMILNGEIPTTEQQDMFHSEALDMMRQTQATRFITILKGEYKKAPMKITINTTGEQRNKAAVLESLNTILMTYAKFPNISTDPVLSMIMMKLIEASGAGISPVSIMSAIEEQKKEAQAMQAQQAQQQAPQGMPEEMPVPNSNPEKPAVPTTLSLAANAVPRAS